MRTAIIALLVALALPALGAEINGSLDVRGHLLVDGRIDIGTVETFTDTDTTPDVSTGVYWNTFTNAITITDFTGTPLAGWLLVVHSQGAVTFDCTASGLDCGSADGVTAAGDVSVWQYDGTNWDLLDYKDQSENVWVDAGAGGGSSWDVTDTDASPVLTVDDTEQVQVIGGTGITVTAAADGANHDITIDGHAVFTPDADPGTNHGSYVAGGDGTDGTAIHDDTASEISAVAVKGTPVSGDFLLIEDSAAANVKKRITIGTLPAGSPGADSIGTAELDDDADTPLTGEYIRVDTVDQAGVEYRTVAEVLADIGAQPASSYSGVGACGANTWASTLNDDAAPGCTQPTCAGVTNCTPSAITGTGVTYENLSTNLDIGFGAAQVPQGAATAPLAGPTFTGDPLAPTPAPEDNDTSIATTAFVVDEVADFDTCAEVTGCVESAITSTGVTYENLSTNGDIGFGAAQVPQGSLAAPLAGPALTGDPTAPTASAGDSDTSVATTDFVDRRKQRFCDTVELLTTADDNVPFFAADDSYTVVGIGCYSDAAVQVTVEDNGGTAVETIDCDTTSPLSYDTTISGTATFTTGEVMQLDTITESTPTWFMLCVEYVND